MRAQRGVTLIEIMIAVVIFGIVMAIGLPNFAAWLQNLQIRGAAESAMAGLQQAKAEAIKRNAPVRFQFVTNLGNCALNTAGPDFVVSMDDPTGNCGAAVSNTAAPRVISSKQNQEGSRNAVIAADAAAVTFNGLGRTSGAGNMTVIDITNPTGGACQTPADVSLPMRCLRIAIAAGGEIRMCDPVVTVNTDPRFC